MDERDVSDTVRLVTRLGGLECAARTELCLAALAATPTAEAMRCVSDTTLWLGALRAQHDLALRRGRFEEMTREELTRAAQALGASAQSADPFPFVVGTVLARHFARRERTHGYGQAACPAFLLYLALGGGGEEDGATSARAMLEALRCRALCARRAEYEDERGHAFCSAECKEMYDRMESET
jgi:hypothetical protein